MKKKESKRIGGIYDGETKHQAGSVWNENFVSPTIDTMEGGQRQPMILEKINEQTNRKTNAKQ